MARKLSFRYGIASIDVRKFAQAVKEIRPFDEIPLSSACDCESFRARFSTTRFLRSLAAKPFVPARIKQKADSLDLLWIYHAYKAAKAGDHLSALLGLANIPYNPLSSPDYTASLGGHRESLCAMLCAIRSSAHSSPVFCCRHIHP